MPTLADLARAGPGLLGYILDASNSLQRNVKNSVRGLLDNPQDFVSMRLAQLAEGLPQLQPSVMPGVDQVGLGPQQPSAMDWGTNMALNAPTIGLLGHTTYHGSPHKFDKFDASKIGTGEGAQAYGHGLYLAESPNVAQSYKEAGFKGFHINGEVVTPSMSQGGPKELAAAALSRFPDKKEAIAWIGNDFPVTGQAAKDIIRKAKSYGDSQGALYKVDLPDEWLPKMLDWDKPLSEQPEAVRKAVRNAIGDQPFDPFDNPSLAAALTGKHPRGSAYSPPMSEVMDDLANALGVHRNSPDMTDLLKQQGIPGIRYLDQGSRDAGKGTYNYVVFPGNEGLLKILERQ